MAFSQAGQPDLRNKPELTCISEEGIADMDLPDHILEELEYLGDCITSCDKVENYLMMSEYENNLVKTSEVPSQGLDRKNRKRLFSLRQNSSTLNGNGATNSSIYKNFHNQREALRRGSAELKLALQSTTTPTAGRSQSGNQGAASAGSLPSSLNQNNSLKSGNFRTITVIEEASV